MGMAVPVETTTRINHQTFLPTIQRVFGSSVMRMHSIKVVRVRRDVFNWNLIGGVIRRNILLASIFLRTMGSSVRFDVISAVNRLEKCVDIMSDLPHPACPSWIERS
jgi:hypothetical protein